MSARWSGTPRRWTGARVRTALFVGLLIVPLVEVFIIIEVAHAIGGWPTLFLLVLWSALGAYLVRREGARAWLALRTALSSGGMPARELADAALVLVGGALLLAPGFLTDVIGLFFVLPFTRPFTRRILQAAVVRQLLRRAEFPGGRPPGAPGGAGGRTPSGAGGSTGSGGAARPPSQDTIEGEVL